MDKNRYEEIRQAARQEIERRKTMTETAQASDDSELVQFESIDQLMEEVSPSA